MARILILNDEPDLLEVTSLVLNDLDIRLKPLPTARKWSKSLDASTPTSSSSIG